MNYEKLPKTISAEELLSTPLPPVKWIIPDLLPAGLALFAGPSKAGKSWLTLWLCLQVAQGKPMWGREIEPHTVIYLSLEDTFNRLQKRLLQLVGSEEAPERLVMQTECSSIGQGLEEQLTSFIYQHPDTGLIVIDTLQKVRSSDQNNSMYASDYKEISALKALADKYNVCILLIHHLRKQAADDPFLQIAGSNGLMGASDTSWVMQRKRMSQTASILVTGRDMDNKTLRLHEENCVWMLDEEESTEQIVAKAVPGYIWKVADYIDSVGTWQGTATELLSAADIEGVLPHQLTRKIVEHFDTVFTPRGIRYETHRTSQARQMKFSHDGNDADDANDAEIDITQLFKWDISQTASSASLASQRSRKESEHLVTLGAVRAAVRKYPDLHIVHFDAHADLRDDYLGAQLSHACVLRRCHDLVGDGRIHQFCIRSGEREEFQFAARHTDMHKFDFTGLAELTDWLCQADVPVYLTIDLDCLDPSAFPGTGTPEAGGVSFLQLLGAIRTVTKANIIGADVNELAPMLDQSGVSTATACKVLRELLLALEK